MRLTINRETNDLIRSLSFPERMADSSGAFTFGTKRGDTPAHDLIFGVPFGQPQQIGVETLKYGLKLAGDFAGDYIVNNWDGSDWAFELIDPITVSDAVTTSGSATLTSATAKFTAADVGRAIAGAGIPSGATLAAVASAASATLSANATATATGVTITIPSRAPLYRVAPSYNTLNLAAALVNGTISQTVANATARLGLTGLAADTIVMQSDTGVAWVLVTPAQIASADGWAKAPQKPYVDLAGEIEITAAGNITSTLTFTERVFNDVNKGLEGAPTNPPDFAQVVEAVAAIPNQRRTVNNYHEYSFDGGTTWWRHAPALLDGRPEFQWIGPLSE